MADNPEKAEIIVHVPRLGGAGLADSKRTFRVVFGSDVTQGAFALCEIRFEAGQVTPIYMHTREDKTFYVLDGLFEVFTGKDAFTARRGSSIYVPRNKPQGFRCVEAGTMLITYVPGGLERMFADLALLDIDALDDMATVQEIAQGYGVKLLRPPGAGLG